MRTAIFPGSFDPFTRGHAALVEQALGLFDKVVIAIDISTLGEPHLLRTRLYSLLIGVFHILTREELRLLDIHTLARARRCNKQVGLTTQECGNLQHIYNLTYRLCLPRLVYVGEDLQAPLRAYVGKHLQALIHTHASV